MVILVNLKSLMLLWAGVLQNHLILVSPIKIPGIIEAEEFDIGVNGIAYSDNSPTNTGFEFRNDEDVDIQLCSDDNNGYNIGLDRNR